MDFTVRLDSGERLEFFNALPPELSHYQSLPVVYTASGQWGRVIFQVLPAAGFSVWYATYMIQERVSLHIQAAMETRELHLAFKNNFDREPAGAGRTQLYEKQFNLSYFPAIDIRLHFGPGEYAGFAINFSKDYLQRFTPYLPGLQGFLHNTEKGIGCHLCARHVYASPEMLSAMTDILAFKYVDDLGSIYIGSEVQTLLAQAIRVMQQERDRPFVITHTDRQRMEEVRRWLQDNQDNPGSLQSIARRFAINEFRLKRDFKTVFGSTVYDHLLELRMQRAVHLLLHTDMPVTEIAYAVGYSHISHFSDAFKKRFGYSPNYLRRHKAPGI